MGIFKKIIALPLLVSSFLFTWEEKGQILFLAQNGNIEKAIELYQSSYKKDSYHHRDILEQIGRITLKHGMKSGNKESELLSIYGAHFAALSSALDICEIGIYSSNPTTQLAAVQLLQGMHDDRAEELLLDAFSSRYFPIRIEAAFSLAKRNSPLALGPLQSLMNQLPPPFKSLFPELFALITSPQSTKILKKLLNDPHLPVRLSTMLSLAENRRDDFIKAIRMNLTHPDPSEQEVAAISLGFLHDTASKTALEKLLLSKNPNVHLAAAFSLYYLGFLDFQHELFNAAKGNNPFALTLLKSVPSSTNLLASFVFHPNFNIRFNAALSLLHMRDPRCVVALTDFLLSDENNIGILPQYSTGGSLIAFRSISCAKQQSEVYHRDIPSITLGIKEKILIDMLELSEASFIHVADKIFSAQKKSLVPLTIALLESLGSKDAITLLKKLSKHSNLPLIRNYAKLALYRTHNDEEAGKSLKEWAEKNQKSQLIQFRPLLSWAEGEKVSAYVLTPEESSRLLIEIFDAISLKQEEENISILLNAMKNGHPQNKYALAGLLIRCLQ